MSMTVISFNFGMPQTMLDDAPWSLTHRDKFFELLNIFGGDYDADMVFGCEIGSHKAGPSEEQRRSLRFARAVPERCQSSARTTCPR